MATQSVNATELNLQQLDRIKTQLDNELQMLTSSMKQLKMVQNRLTHSKEYLQHMKTENDDKSILVPLTSSMYVPGRMEDSAKVMVDIGTGYYVEKDNAEANKFFQRKIDYVTKNLEKMQQVMIEKHKIRENIVLVMQQKLSLMQQGGQMPQQQQQREIKA